MADGTRAGTPPRRQSMRQSMRQSKRSPAVAPPRQSMRQSMQRQPTAFDALSPEELKQILNAHYNAADLSEPEREEYLSIVSEEQDVSELVELCLSENLEPAMPARVPPPRQSMRTPPRQKTHMSAPSEDLIHQPDELDDIVQAERENMLETNSVEATNGATIDHRAPPPLPSKKGAVRDRVSTGQWKGATNSFQAAGGSETQSLNLESVKAFLRTENVQVDDEYAAQCFANFDVDGSGGLSIDEFALLLEQLTPMKLGMDPNSSDFGVNETLKTTAWLQRRKTKMKGFCK